MTLPLNERRGLNRQDAIDYLGIKGTYFDKEIRPLLRARKMGTSMVFDRLELDSVFEQIMLVGGDVGPTVKGATQWPKPQVLPKPKTAAGESIRPTKELDFKDVLRRIKQRKIGC
ncbi:MAG: hypothetical protein HYZ46_04335 [Nitrosomonadales bacterium]|nr:hypothetical protein [Nitrosomonadales bacterium]